MKRLFQACQAGVRRIEPASSESGLDPTQLIISFPTPCRTCAFFVNLRLRQLEYAREAAPPENNSIRKPFTNVLRARPTALDLERQPRVSLRHAQEGLVAAV